MKTFYTVHEGFMARILRRFAIPFSGGPLFVALSTMTCLSWVALPGMAMAHSFTELDTAVSHVTAQYSYLKTH